MLEVSDVKRPNPHLAIKSPVILLRSSKDGPGQKLLIGQIRLFIEFEPASFWGYDDDTRSRVVNLSNTPDQV